MPHSKRNDSFCFEDELFFESYQAELANSKGSEPIDIDAGQHQGPSAEQLAHLTRFRKPVAWVMAAMGSLSLLALGQPGLRQNSRREVVAHVGAARTLPSSGVAKNLAAVSEAPWSWNELAESAIALLLEPAQPGASARGLPALSEPTAQAHLVNEFTSELLSMCRNVPA